MATENPQWWCSIHSVSFNAIQEGLQLSAVDLDQLLALRHWLSTVFENQNGSPLKSSERVDSSPRLNIETQVDGGRDGFSDFPGSPTIIIQVRLWQSCLKQIQCSVTAQESLFEHLHLSSSALARSSFSANILNNHAAATLNLNSGLRLQNLQDHTDLFC